MSWPPDDLYFEWEVLPPPRPQRGGQQFPPPRAVNWFIPQSRQRIWDGDETRQCPTSAADVYLLEHEPHPWIDVTSHEITQGRPDWINAGPAICLTGFWCPGNLAWRQRARAEFIFATMVTDPYRITVITNG